MRGGHFVSETVSVHLGRGTKRTEGIGAVLRDPRLRALSRIDLAAGFKRARDEQRHRLPAGSSTGAGPGVRAAIRSLDDDGQGTDCRETNSDRFPQPAGIEAAANPTDTEKDMSVGKISEGAPSARIGDIPSAYLSSSNYIVDLLTM